jgi:glycine cleavage system protein P-like pyridoxal-binding family
LKIPHKIRITSKISYEVLHVDAFDDESQLGECRFDTKQILIKRDQSETDVAKTLIHEVFHAISEEYGAELPHGSIYILENAVLKVLKLNKWIKPGR